MKIVSFKGLSIQEKTVRNFEEDCLEKRRRSRNATAIDLATMETTKPSGTMSKA